MGYAGGMSNEPKRERPRRGRKVRVLVTRDQAVSDSLRANLKRLLEQVVEHVSEYPDTRGVSIALSGPTKSRHFTFTATDTPEEHTGEGARLIGVLEVAKRDLLETFE